MHDTSEPLNLSKMNKSMSKAEQMAEQKYPYYESRTWMDGLLNAQTNAQRAAFIKGWNADKWISVEERPLFTTDNNGNWTCTEDGEKEFLAAVSYVDANQPQEKNLWWIRHCVIEDGVGLCVVGDNDNEPTGWQIEDVIFYQPLPQPPKTK